MHASNFNNYRNIQIYMSLWLLLFVLLGDLCFKHTYVVPKWMCMCVSYRENLGVVSFSKYYAMFVVYLFVCVVVRAVIVIFYFICDCDCCCCCYFFINIMYYKFKCIETRYISFWYSKSITFFCCHRMARTKHWKIKPAASNLNAHPEREIVFLDICL